MANYVLSLDKGKGIFEEILWKQIPEFSKLNNYMLSDLDIFTSSFNNEEEIKEKLIISGLITKENYNKKLCIRYKSRGKVKKLGYGLFYSDDKRFLDDAYITYYLESNIEQLSLLEKLCNHYRNSYIQGSNILAIRNYINLVKNGADLFPEDLENIISAIKDFVLREIYSYDASTYKYKCDNSGNPIIKYKGLHDLGLFLAYDKRKRIKKEKDDINSLSKRPQTNIIPLEKQKVKIKCKKNSQVPGQLSLFE